MLWKCLFLLVIFSHLFPLFNVYYFSKICKVAFKPSCSVDGIKFFSEYPCKSNSIYCWTLVFTTCYFMVMDMHICFKSTRIQAYKRCGLLCRKPYFHSFHFILITCLFHPNPTFLFLSCLPPLLFLYVHLIPHFFSEGNTSWYLTFALFWQQ